MPYSTPPSRASTGRRSPDRRRPTLVPPMCGGVRAVGVRDARTTLMGQVRPHERRRIRCVVPPAHRRAPGRSAHGADEQAVPAARLAAAGGPVHRLRDDGMGAGAGPGLARSATWRRAGRHRDDGSAAAGHPGVAAVPDHTDRGRRGRSGARRPGSPAADGSRGVHRRGAARRAGPGLERDSRARSGFQTDRCEGLHHRGRSHSWRSSATSTTPWW